MHSDIEYLLLLKVKKTHIWWGTIFVIFLRKKWRAVCLNKSHLHCFVIIQIVTISFIFCLKEQQQFHDHLYPERGRFNDNPIRSNGISDHLYINRSCHAKHCHQFGVVSCHVVMYMDMVAKHEMIEALLANANNVDGNARHVAFELLYALSPPHFLSRHL